MRLAGLALSAALLSGCSYIGGFGDTLGGVFSGPSQGYYAGSSGTAGAGFSDPCQIPYAQAPIPPGCHPSQVSVATPGTNSYAGGFPQQPQFGNPSAYDQSQAQYATGGYGSHASGNIHAPAQQVARGPRLRRPNFRGFLDLGAEHSISGNVLDYGKFPVQPLTGYDPDVYNETIVSGSITDGQISTQEYFVNSRLPTTPEKWDETSMPSISLDDAWSVPSTIGVGGEFILGDRATVFARAGYTRSEGNSGDTASIEGTVYERTTNQFYESGVLVGTSTGTVFNTEQLITEYSYDFSDMERIDLEAGGRLYFNPVAGQSTGRTVTPFVSASAGASRYNDVSFTIDQRQLSYSSVYNDPANEYYDLDVAGYDLDANPATPTTRTVDLYESQWVPSGSLKAGVEWQVTPKTAFAFETGLRVEGARDYANGTKGDTNIAVPMTLRGSFNF